MSITEYLVTEFDKQRLRGRLKLLESDLKDSEDPAVLARWPNLGSVELKRQLAVRIDELERQLREMDSV